MRSGILVFPALQELEEFLRPALFEQAHKGALHRFHLRTRDLGDLALAVHVAARDLLELEVAGDIGVDEDLGELARGDDELGDEIDGVISVASEVGGRGLIFTEFTVELYIARDVR